MPTGPSRCRNRGGSTTSALTSRRICVVPPTSSGCRCPRILSIAVTGPLAGTTTTRRGRRPGMVRRRQAEPILLQDRHPELFDAYREHFVDGFEHRYYNTR